MSASVALQHLPTDPVCSPLVSSDQALIAASRAGDSRAFEEIYRRYRKGIRDLCRRMLGDSAKAEDITQETVIRAYLRMDKFQEGKSLWPWLSTIAHHLCIDEIRGLRRVPVASEEAATEMEEVLGGDLTSEEAIARHEQAQLRARLYSALASLPPSDRRVVLLRSVEEWTYEDIARTDGRTIDAIRNAAWRARTTLRTLLDGERERAKVSALGGMPALFRFRMERARARMVAFFNGQLTAGKIFTPIGESFVVAYLGMASLTLGFLASGDFHHQTQTIAKNKTVAVKFVHDMKKESSQKGLDKTLKSVVLSIRNLSRSTPSHYFPVEVSHKHNEPRPDTLLPGHDETRITVENNTGIGPPVKYEYTDEGNCNGVGSSILPQEGPIRAAC